MLVEQCGLMILGMDQQGANSHNICSLKRPQHGIFEQTSSDSLVVPWLVYGEPRQQHDRNGMMGQSFRDSCRRLIVRYRSHSQRVIPDHRVTGQPDIRGRCPAVLVLKRVRVQKTIEILIAAVECVDRVARMKFFDPWNQRSPVLVGTASKNPGSVNTRCRRGRERVGASNAR